MRKDKNKTIIVSEKTLAAMVVSFPAIYIWYSIIGRNASMRVFYFVYCMILLLLFVIGNKYRVKRELGVLLSAVLIKLAYDSFAYPTSMSDAIEFGILLIALDVIQRKEIREKYYNFLIKRQRFVTATYIIYLAGVLFTFLNGTGITNRWGTFSVQGPYGLAHIFSYELIVLSINSYILWNGTKNIRWMLFFILFMILTVLTNVRTVFVAILIAVGYIFFVRNGVKKFAYAIGIAVVVYLIFRFTPLFSFVIRKTMNAINNGSITNYRYEIWMSSLRHFLSQPLRNKLLGSGINSLMEWNVKNVRMYIQAHNDFLTVLDAFGLLSLGAYLWYLIKCSMGKGGVGFILFLLSLIFFNGMYSYCSFVIGLVAIRLFFDICVNYNNPNIREPRKARE